MTNLDASTQYIHQYLPLKVLREILSTQRIPVPSLSLSTIIILRILYPLRLIVRRTERPNRVHPVSVLPQVLPTSLPRMQVVSPASNAGKLCPHSLHVSPPWGEGRIKRGPVQTVRRFDDHRRRRSFRGLPELDHECLTTLSISTSREHLSGGDAPRDRELEGIVVGVEPVDAPQPRDNWTFVTVRTFGT